jgi:hypothetical protein
MGSSRCCRPGTSWGATGRPNTDGVRRIARLQDIGHPGGPAIRRGEDRHPFSACQKRARQWECTHRNLQVTGEEERIKESNRDAAGCSTKNSFCCPRSYLVCPSSSSSIAPKASKGWLPEICRPLMKNVGVPVTPSCAPSIKSR